MSENTNLVEYYKNLLIMQYHDKPKALEHIQTLIDAGMIYDIAIAVRDGFNVETAQGVQQDIIGKYLGVSRTITGAVFTREYFGYMEYGDTSPFDFNPYMKYGDTIPDVQFRNYKESNQSLYNLTNEEYRTIQKLVIIKNNSNASVKDIDTLLYQLFGAEVLFYDRLNMSIAFIVNTNVSRLFTIAKSSGLLPNPSGVGVSITSVPDINNIFSYSQYGGDMPTFAVGYILYGATDKTGCFASYS